MSKLNFALGYGFLAAVAFVFIIGEFTSPQSGVHDLMAQLEQSTPARNIQSAVADQTIPDDPENLKVNKAGIGIIRTWEGLSLSAYPEADYWLIGYGHTGPEVHEGMETSVRTADRYLTEDLAVYEEFVRSVVAVPLNRNEFSALVVLSYNIGNGAFRNSTVLRRLNEGDRSGAADAFLMWNKIKRDGKLTTSQALTKRRENERSLFLSDS